MCAGAIVLARLPAWCSGPPTRRPASRARWATSCGTPPEPPGRAGWRASEAEECGDLLRVVFPGTPLALTALHRGRAHPLADQRDLGAHLEEVAASITAARTLLALVTVAVRRSSSSSAISPKKSFAPIVPTRCPRAPRGRCPPGPRRSPRGRSPGSGGTSRMRPRSAPASLAIRSISGGRVRTEGIPEARRRPCRHRPTPGPAAKGGCSTRRRRRAGAANGTASKAVRGLIRLSQVQSAPPSRVPAFFGPPPFPRPRTDRAAYVVVASSPRGLRAAAGMLRPQRAPLAIAGGR